MPEQTLLSPGERDRYEERLRGLEERLEQMRLSRRILMCLLEQSLSQRDQELERLSRENARLRRQLSAAAKRLLSGQGNHPASSQ